MNYNIDTNFPKNDPLEIYTPESKLLTTVATVNTTSFTPIYNLLSANENNIQE